MRRVWHSDGTKVLWMNTGLQFDNSNLFQVNFVNLFFVLNYIIYAVVLTIVKRLKKIKIKNNNIYIHSDKVKHHPIFLSIYFVTSILLKQ
jgi:cytochrome c oxidase assembly factor CtaG